MRVDKIAKMLIGVENLVVQGVAYDEEQGCIVISARPTLPHARECGKCGRKAPVYARVVGAEGGAAWIWAGYGVLWSPRLTGWLVPNAE